MGHLQFAAILTASHIKLKLVCRKKKEIKDEEQQTVIRNIIKKQQKHKDCIKKNSHTQE